MCYPSVVSREGKEKLTPEQQRATERLAAYFQTLRNRYRWSKAALARRAGISGMSVGRIEDALQEPGALALTGLVYALGADWGEVERIIRDDTLTVQDAHRIANERWPIASRDVLNRVMTDVQAAKDRQAAARVRRIPSPKENERPPSHRPASDE